MESGKIIVVANQKGGVAKTSTVRNLSYALAEMGKKVLVVDFDPQYNLTTSFGVLPTQAPYNTVWNSLGKMCRLRRHPTTCLRNGSMGRSTGRLWRSILQEKSACNSMT